MKKNQIDIITLGCSKNLVDSELLMKQFEAIDGGVPAPAGCFRDGTRTPETRRRMVHGRLSRVLGRHRPQGLSRRRVAVGGRRLYRHPYLQLLRPGVPRFLRRAALHQGRQARQDRRRPARPLCQRQAVHALPRHDRDGGKRSRPPEVPHEARGRARREQVGAHHVG